MKKLFSPLNKTISKPTICLDMDEVLNNLKDVWVELYNKKYNDSLNPDNVIEWDMSKFVKPECGKKINDLLKTPKLFSELVTPREYSIEITKTLQEVYDLYVVSYCCFPENLTEKYNFLQKHFPHIPLSNFISCKNKFMICGDYLVDDYHENLRDFKGECILYNAPHNKVIDSTISAKVNRVDNWLDILEYFEKYVGW